ncbi:MAG: hypothetical protein RLZZ76_583 [Candidatus Parcubacteria bacterium]|jgi:hypothetical protein
MENTEQPMEAKVKSLTLKSVVAWIFGGLLILAGVGLFTTSIIGGIVMLLAGAILLPPTFSLIQKKLNINLSGGLRAVIVIIFLAIAGSTMDTNEISKVSPEPAGTVAEKSPTPTAQVNEETKTEPAIEVTSTALVAEFKENAVAAEQKYGEKRIRVTGVVHSIDKDILDTPYVALSGDQYGINNVQCMFPKDRADDLVSFKKDSRATVEGVFSSNLMNVLLKDCTVVVK